MRVFFANVNARNTERQVKEKVQYWYLPDYTITKFILLGHVNWGKQLSEAFSFQKIHNKKTKFKKSFKLATSVFVKN